jgi:hypothetical protein
MSTSLNLFAVIFVLLCVFSVVVRDFLSGSALFCSFLASCAVILTATFLKSEIFLLFIAIFALLARPVTIFARDSRAKKAFRANLRPVLTRLILNLKSGMSLRTALRHEKSVEQLCQMLEAQKFLPSGDGRWDDFARLLISLDRDPARILPQLEGFRRGLHIEDKFSARVRQILLQPRLQAAVILVLYVGLIFFVMNSFSVEDFRQPLIFSALLVAAGCFQLFWLGRNYQWKA